MLRRAWFCVSAALAMLVAVPAFALNGMSVELGGGEGVDRARVGVQWDWNVRWFQGSDWHLGGYWEALLGQWHRGNAAAGQNSDITELGFTPVLRIQPNALTGPYVEAAIGVHLLSRSRIGDKRMSTRFQFGDHIGVGYRFGARGALDLGYRFQHHSNAGIKRPNPGINFHDIRLQYHF